MRTPRVRTPSEQGKGWSPDALGFSLCWDSTVCTQNTRSGPDRAPPSARGRKQTKETCPNPRTPAVCKGSHSTCGRKTLRTRTQFRGFPTHPFPHFGTVRAGHLFKGTFSDLKIHTTSSTVTFTPGPSSPRETLRENGRRRQRQPARRSTHFLRRRPYSSRRSSLEMGFRCMKLQKPPRVHSLRGRQRPPCRGPPPTPRPRPPGPRGPPVTYPISYWRQHASLKSVTGDSSAWIGCPLNQRLFKSITAFSASSSRRNWKDRSKGLAAPTRREGLRLPSHGYAFTWLK